MRSVYSYFLILFNVVAFGQTADVFDVARRGTVAEAEVLLKADPNAFQTVSPEGFTPLILACYRGNSDVAKFLISNGSDINSISSMGTALMAAVVKGNVEISKLLLEYKADPNLTDANGTTALMYAVKFQNSDLIKLLLAYRADKAVVDKDKKTAFEHAVFSGNNQIIELLK